MPEYRTPGVYIEEISSGPRPVAASATTDTGFVAVLTLPKSFLAGSGAAKGLFLPAPEESASMSWNRALAFRGLIGAEDAGAAAAGGDAKDKAKPAAAAKPKSGNNLQALIDDLLEGKWQVEAPNGSGNLTITSDDGVKLRVPVRSSLVSVKTSEKGEKEWDLAFGADEIAMTQLVAGSAQVLGVKHTGNLPCVDAKASVKIDVDAIYDALSGSAPALTSMDGYHQWRSELGTNIAVQIMLQNNPKLTQEQAEALFESLPGGARKAWDNWLRSHPGIRRLELGLTGFFSNGGKTAYPAVVIQADGTGGPPKRAFLEASFDGVSNVAMLAAPGLEFAWQQAILEYAGPSGRGDLFAIVEAPRYMFTKAPRGLKLTPYRWVDDSTPYEMASLETVPSPDFTELRFMGFSADEILDRSVPRDNSGYGAAYGPWLVVDNPLSTGPTDKYIIAPPAGHVAGVIAATDLKPGGGVHKAPANEMVLGVAEIVTQISDREQAALNPKGINVIRHRPFAGIRIWGARTVASDPLWNYINVRRLFLFVERSVRDAIAWAVFLPNTNSTRADLKATISAFLYTCYSQGMLDGDTWKDAFSVQCDTANNNDIDVRSGLLTVDVQMRPVYPAEFVRVRFQQSPMRSAVTEG